MYAPFDLRFAAIVATRDQITPTRPSVPDRIQPAGTYLAINLFANDSPHPEPKLTDW
jgi:hypothetical protein